MGKICPVKGEKRTQLPAYNAKTGKLAKPVGKKRLRKPTGTIQSP